MKKGFKQRMNEKEKGSTSQTTQEWEYKLVSITSISIYSITTNKHTQTKRLKIRKKIKTKNFKKTKKTDLIFYVYTDCNS